MHKRAVRLTIVALLLAAGVAAAVVSWKSELRFRELERADRELSSRIDSLSAAVADAGLTQRVDVSAGPGGAAADGAIADLVRQFDADMPALRAAVRSVEAPGILESIAEALAPLGSTDSGARQYLADSREYLAADLILSGTRENLVRLQSNLRALRTAETAVRAGEQTTVRQDAWTVTGTAAALWLIGLLLLVPVPRPAAARPPQESAPVATIATGSPASEAVSPAAGATIDLAAAAAVCTDLARISSSAALPDLLARVALILDARGLIVWMGAGDQLFLAAAHGYDQRIVNRLAPIARDSSNATATAWRTGRLGSVPAGASGNAAIVTPMFNPTHCIGVLAAEVPAGRETDRATRAVTAMIAAQLATIVAAWPAASTEPAAAAAPLDRAAG